MFFQNSAHFIHKLFFKEFTLKLNFYKVASKHAFVASSQTPLQQSAISLTCNLIFNNQNLCLCENSRGGQRPCKQLSYQSGRTWQPKRTRRQTSNSLTSTFCFNFLRLYFRRSENWMRQSWSIEKHYWFYWLIILNKISAESI